MKRLVYVLTASFAALGPAAAADLAPRAVEPIAPVYLPFNWTGFYVGAQAGYQFGKISGPFENSAQTGSAPYSIDTDGGVFGGFAGYNHQFSNFVVGAEGDANFVVGTKKTDRNLPFTFFGAGAPAGFADIGGEQTWNASLRLRAGYAFDRFLPYVTGGVAFGNVKTFYAPAGLPDALTQETDRVGWTIGAGMEYAITDHILARLEYRYADLGKKSFTNIPLNVHDEVKATTSTVLAGIIYKF